MNFKIPLREALVDLLRVSFVMIWLMTDAILSSGGDAGLTSPLGFSLSITLACTREPWGSLEAGLSDGVRVLRTGFSNIAAAAACVICILLP
jgi:hypothetical protein